MADVVETPVDQVNTLPGAVVRRRRLPSPVWLIPLAALLVGIWLLFQYWQQRGEVITVRFPSAEGIVAGSTEVRYKAVTVGKVKQVILDDDLNPLVTLSLGKSISRWLDCSAQFWVVKPRVRGAEISGLGTLFSGTYVGMIPERTESQLNDDGSMFCYAGLDGAPVIKPDRPGREFTLIANSMGSLDIGSPLFYKQLEVGEVIRYKLSEATGQIELGIFVDQPYYQFINNSTRFWNASGAEFKMDSVGAEFRMESLTSLIIGGVAFDSAREGNDNIIASKEFSSFTLHPDFESSREKHYSDQLYYTVYFNGSLRGLGEEAPVEFKGIRVGKVEKIKMYLDPDDLDVRIPVLISIEPQRFSEEITSQSAGEFMENMVAKGMRATLQSGNLLTGQKYVALGFDKKAVPDSIKRGQFHAVFPSSSTQVEELSELAVGVAEDVKVTLAGISEFMESRKLDKTIDSMNQVLGETEATVVAARRAMEDVSQLLAKIESDTLPRLTGDASKVLRQLDEKTLPAISGNIDRVSKDVSRVMQRVDSQTLPALARGVNQLTEDTSKVMQQVNKETLPAVRSTSGTINKASTDFSRSTHELNKTMQRLQGTLTHLDRMLAQNSPTQHQVMEMMEEVTRMARSVRLLTEQLERQPESVLRGKRELK
uniref:Paraquat-inducible protein B n=1 Tax=uncultured Thiotrichaceae bacterium TaxID=298394 RepID=A0A6S6SW63_9GAMM|nr:MAG: Paraquat-inducible protein B [uncultured Thiotrichaceae bacterium]